MESEIPMVIIGRILGSENLKRVVKYQLLLVI